MVASDELKIHLPPQSAKKPYLNLGAGRIILPYRPGTYETEKAAGTLHELQHGYGRPHHHQLIDPAIYAHPLWVNADRNVEAGVDCEVDLFTYPWPFEDNQFAGALASHIVEHIPHEIKLVGTRSAPQKANFEEGLLAPRWGVSLGIDHYPDDADIRNAKRLDILAQLQDGWYAFFAELYRVLEPGAIAHILAPYGWSQGAITDPTHTRLVTEHTFSHSMQPDPQSPFKYATGGIHFQMLSYSFTLMPEWSHLVVNPGDPPDWVASKTYRFQQALQTHLNVAYELYVQLRAVKT